MDGSDELLAAKLGRLRILCEEQNNAAEYEAERERHRVAEHNDYLTRNEDRKLAENKEDVRVYKHHQLDIATLELKEEENDRKRQETYKDLRFLDEREECRRNDDLKRNFQILNRQHDQRQNQREKEIMMDTTARRERNHDRQVEGDRNLIRDKNRMAAQEKLALSYSESYQNVFDARGRCYDKRIEYQERRKNAWEARGNANRNMFQYMLSFRPN